MPTTTALHLLNGGKIQILILHGAKAIKISVSLTLSTVSFSYKSAENINLQASDAFFKEECFTFSKIGICIAVHRSAAQK